MPLSRASDFQPGVTNNGGEGEIMPQPPRQKMASQIPALVEVAMSRTKALSHKAATCFTSWLCAFVRDYGNLIPGRRLMGCGTAHFKNAAQL